MWSTSISTASRTWWTRSAAPRSCFVYPTRDRNTGLDQQPGCHVLDGLQSLQYREKSVLRGVPRRRMAYRSDAPTSVASSVSRTSCSRPPIRRSTSLRSDPFLASEADRCGHRDGQDGSRSRPVGAAGTLRKAFTTGLSKYQLPVVRRDEATATPSCCSIRAPNRSSTTSAASALRHQSSHRPCRSEPAPTLRSVMKALILAGGAGTRLRPITHTRAKQLVPVANTPILHYGIQSMVAAGITQLGVIVGDTRDEVMNDLGDGSRFGASITFIPQDEPLGLAHCVLIAREFLGEDDFVMYLGDNLLEQDLAAFVEAFARRVPGEQPPSAQILLKEVERSAALRYRLARRRRTRRTPRREAGRSAVQPRPRRRVSLRLRDPRSCRCDRAVGPGRTRDHRRDPMADRSRSSCPHGDPDRVVDRHRQADAAARGEPPDPRDDRHTDRRRRRRRVVHRWSCGRGGWSGNRQLDDPWTRGDRVRAPR